MVNYWSFFLASLFEVTVHVLFHVHLFLWGEEFFCCFFLLHKFHSSFVFQYAHWFYLYQSIIGGRGAGPRGAFPKKSGLLGHKTPNYRCRRRRKFLKNLGSLRKNRVLQKTVDLSTSLCRFINITMWIFRHYYVDLWTLPCWFSDMKM